MEGKLGTNGRRKESEDKRTTKEKREKKYIHQIKIHNANPGTYINIKNNNRSKHTIILPQTVIITQTPNEIPYPYPFGLKRGRTPREPESAASECFKSKVIQLWHSFRLKTEGRRELRERKICNMKQSKEMREIWRKNILREL